MLPVLRTGPFGCVSSSPSARCRLPATLIARALSIPLRLDERLAELDFGTWEGREWGGIDRATLDVWATAPLDFTPPGGEPIPALVARIRTVARDLLSGSGVVLLSHGGPLRILDRLLRGLPIDPHHPAPSPGTVLTIRTP